MTPDFVAMLSGGHPNSLGRTEEVVEMVAEDERLLGALCDTLATQDELVRMRVGDAIEKVCRRHPEWFKARIGWILSKMGNIDQPSVQWHVAQVLERIDLTSQNRRRATEWLWRIFRESNDWIVLSETLTTLSHFALSDESLREPVRNALKETQHDTRKAVAKRASRLLAMLDAPSVH
jgi:hypothetical protein